MGSDRADDGRRRGTLESQVRFPGRWALSFAVLVTVVEVMWAGTSWLVGAMWGAITGVIMWIYSRSKLGRRRIARRIDKLDDSN